MYRLLLLAIGVLVYGSLYPWHFDFTRDVDPLSLVLQGWPVRWSIFDLRDIVLNLLMYAPLGAAAFLAFVRRHSRQGALGFALATGMTLSWAMELLQAYVPGRTPSLCDVVCNSAGTLAGAVVAAAFRLEWERATRHLGRLSTAALLPAACWAGYQLYPLIPALSRTRLRAEMAVFASLQSVSVMETWTATAEWFGAALVLEALLGRMRTRWLAVAMACVPLRLLIAGRVLAAEEVLGAAVALLLWSVRGRLRLSPLTVGLAMLSLTVVVRELAPFQFSEEVSTFSWVPFRGSLESSRLPAVVVLLRKAFDYGAVVWLLGAVGVPYWRGGVATGAALLLLELLQCRLPGRTPEISDALLALLLALMLWGLSKYRSFGRRLRGSFLDEQR